MAAVIAAGGAHVPGLMDQLEERLQELARSHGDGAGRARVRHDRGRRQATAPAAGAAGRRPVAGAPGARAAGDGRGRADPLRHARARRRARRRRAAARPADGGRRRGPRDRDRHRRPAVLARVRRAGAQRRARSRCGCCRTRRRALAEGELLQREDAWNVGVSRERYEQRCDLKTARLFQAACELGALEGTAPVDVLGRFGRRIGLAFQMLDDVLDVSGPAERTGKHRGTDLLDGTVTLPLILARERDPALRSLDLRAVRTPAQAEAVCDAIAATGVLEDARATALGHRRRREGGSPGAAGGPAGSAGAGGRRRRRPVQLAATTGLEVFGEDRVRR